MSRERLDDKVTDAIHALAGRGLIRAERGNIRIIDRDGLVENANGCYGETEREYRRLFGGQDIAH